MEGLVMDGCSRRFTALAVIAAAAGLPAAAGAAEYGGTFALQGGAPLIEMHLDLVRGATPLDARVDLWATRRNGTAPLTRYDTTHTKKIHLVVVSDDLSSFMHVHPALRAGHFVEDLHVPRPALYHIFADVTPTGIGQQVYRFDVAFGSAGRTPVAATVASRVANAGPYRVTLNTSVLHTTRVTAVAVSIEKGGTPARDLTAYLGAPAHAVLIHPADWTYLHVHPTEASDAMAGMAAMSGTHAMADVDLPATAVVGPTMMLHVNAREPGAYRCWLEFRGGGSVYDAAFNLNAR
jgi:hypothetical protein